MVQAGEVLLPGIFGNFLKDEDFNAFLLPDSTTTSATTAMSPWMMTHWLRSATRSHEQFLTVQCNLIDQLFLLLSGEKKLFALFMMLS